MEIRLLTVDDWKIWKQLRLEALFNSPESFGSSYEEESMWSVDRFQQALKESCVFGAVVDNQLVASAAFYSLQSLKTKHRAIVWGVYTQPAFRGRGIASSLIETIIFRAREAGVMQLHLTCTTTNVGAVKLYQNHGFKIYGTEPRALMVAGQFYDEYLMARDLSK